MIGIVLVTHGNLAREFFAALEHVAGPQQYISMVCIGAADDMEQRRQEILEKVRECDSGDGVVVLTDMFGGTPSNLAISIMDQAAVEVLAGVNLPMLVKLASVRAANRRGCAYRPGCGEKVHRRCLEPPGQERLSANHPVSDRPGTNPHAGSRGNQNLVE